jgi:hypothetical protein
MAPAGEPEPKDIYGAVTLYKGKRPNAHETAPKNGKLFLNKKLRQRVTLPFSCFIVTEADNAKMRENPVFYTILFMCVINSGRTEWFPQRGFDIIQ